MTAEPVTIILAGEPVAWARARPGRQANGGGGFLITPKKQRNAGAALRYAASEAMRGRPPLDCAVSVDLSAEMRIPASMSKKDKDRAIRGELRPAKKPDLSNIAKLAEDAMNEIVYSDDKLIVEYTTLRKVYSLSPKLVITVRPIEGMRESLAGAAE